MMLYNEIFGVCVWPSYAEQLVLYMKTAELLSSALHSAMEGIKEGKLYPSSTVKQGEGNHFICPGVQIKRSMLSSNLKRFHRG